MVYNHLLLQQKKLQFNLVIADYITSAESKTAEVYGNTMDDVYTANQDINNPTRGGRIGNLSYYDTFGMPQLQPYWFVRAPKVVTDNLSVADNFTFKINRLLGGDLQQYGIQVQ